MSDQNDAPPSIAQLRRQVDESWEPVLAAVAKPALNLSATDADGWTLVDHLAHITAWERALLATLAGRPWRAGMGLGDLPQAPGDTDAINALLLERNRSRPFGAVVAEARQTHQQVLAALGRLSDDDLTRPNVSFDPDEQGPFRDEPILGWIAVNSYQHYQDHLPTISALAARPSGPTPAQ